MKFTIPNATDNLQTLVRRIGYRPLGYTPEKELNCVRPLGANYPRFHLYIRDLGMEGYAFSLHLDQKKPSYEGATAHSGDYESETVRAEGERIRSVIGG